MSNNNVKEVVIKARSVPPAIYHLGLINLVMFIGFVINELTLIYMLGSLLLVIMVVAALGKVSGFWETPSQLISQNVHQRLQQLRADFQNMVKYLDVKELETSSVNTIIVILLIVYTGSMFNGTLQIFIIVNFLFCLVFLPQETEGCTGMVKEQASNIKRKISRPKN